MPASHYSTWVRRLHWLVFLLVAGALLLIYIHGWTARGTVLHAQVKWAHMQFGIAVLLVMLPRLLVRSRSKAPPVLPPAPRWQDLLAKMMHLVLYMLLFATPLLGIASRLWNPAPWDFLGIPLPHVPVPDKHFGHAIEDIHETFGNVLMYLAALHAVAALFHHFIQRDNALKRMLPPARAED